MAFTQSFDRFVCCGDAIECEVDGFTVVARIVSDDSGDTPWERDEGHGPVSEWTTREKRPGERVLISDRHSRRYYDFAEACRIARADGWGAAGDEGMKPRAKAAHAAEADFRALKAWCDDEWHYVGVVLSVERNGIVLDRHAASLWGIEANYPGSDNSYLMIVANELLEEVLEVGRIALSQLCDCEA